jgi:hypothetical protein
MFGGGFVGGGGGGGVGRAILLLFLNDPPLPETIVFHIHSNFQDIYTKCAYLFCQVRGARRQLIQKQTGDHSFFCSQIKAQS